MARKGDLRTQRTGTVINRISKKQETELDKAVKSTAQRLIEEFPGIRLSHKSNWLLKDVVANLRESFAQTLSSTSTTRALQCGLTAAFYLS